MSLPRRPLALLSIALAFAAAAPAQAQEAPAARPSMLERAVNVVHVTGWNVYGPNQTHAIREAEVQGGHALRVDVTSPGANPWDVSAGSLNTRPVRSGDVLLLAVWMRAERAPQDAATGQATLRLQGAAAPYPEIGSATVQPGGHWKLYFANGVASRDFGPGELGAAVHLAGAVQAVDLGPVFILDMGPDYDRASLPTN